MFVVIQVALIVAFAPLLQGTMKQFRARLQGRPGPHVIQPYRDVRKLWSKAAVLPEGTSIVTLAAPGIALGVAVTFAATLPFRAAPLENVDVVALAFLLGVGRFALALAALDVRSSFTGMAASREMTFASLVEPALLVALLGGAILGHGSSLHSLSLVPPGPASLLAFAAFFLVMLVETARIPVDNQETHYELTMMHEGLTLEYSGWHLAVVSYASWVRQACFFALAALVLAPGAGVLGLALCVPALAALVTLVETFYAKLRLFEVPQVLMSAFVLATASVALRIFRGSA